MNTTAVTETKEVVRAVVIRDGKVLLMRRAQTDAFAGQWEFPGGKTDGQDSDFALARELHEESSLRLISVDELAHERTHRPSAERLYRERTYIVTAQGQVQRSDEHDAHDWFDPDNPPYPMAPAVLPVLEDLYARLRAQAKSQR